MNDWSDETFDWAGLNSAIYYIMDTWRIYGRIGSHGKEKWGQFRDYPCFWDGGIWSLFYPGYVYIKPSWRFIYFTLDFKLVIPFTRATSILWLGHWWQRQVYNYAIQRACKKYPHLTENLVRGIDGYELVKPGIFGKVDGTKIHNKYWRHA